MSLSENDKRVLRLIKVGAENSTTGADISRLTKLSERAVQDTIKRLIVKHNIPIVGVRNGIYRGYFIPRNKGELLDGAKAIYLSLIHISEPTRLHKVSRMPSSD